MTSKYKFVILGNGNDWCEISYADVRKIQNAKMFNKPLPCPYHRLLSKIAKLHYSQTLRHLINLPFKDMWFPYFAKCICENKDENLVVIIFDKHQLGNNPSFLAYLKNHFSNIKLIYVFTNIVSKSGAFANNFINKLNKFYDLTFTYDFGDATNFHFNYFPNAYSLLRREQTKKEKKVFFVGKAKDRLNQLINAYERLTNIGIGCDFHIVDVPSKLQKHQNSISYNKPLSYNQVIDKIQDVCCLLDITQGKSEGFTLRVNEAVFYNKLLITTNENVKKEPFYNPKFIKIINSPSDINEDMFAYWDIVKFSEEDKKYFAIETFFTEIEKKLAFKSLN